MASKFDHFAQALAALCRQHHVAIAPTEDGHIGVWDVNEGDEPAAGLLDCTGEQPTPWSPASVELPPYFLTILAAKEFPGYIGHEVVESRASTLAAKHTGAQVVPIGPPKRVRSWAVIKPDVSREST